MHSSTVARRDEVPAKGNKEKATLPKGHETSLVKGGVGTTNEEEKSEATAGILGSMVVAAARVN